MTLEKIAVGFGIDPTRGLTWLKKTDIDDGMNSGMTATGSAELREASKRIRLLEQEAEVLKRALAYMSQGSLPGKGRGHACDRMSEVTPAATSRAVDCY